MKFPISKKNISIISWGIYTPWNDKSKNLPKIKNFTTNIPIEIGLEWGMILEINNSKGKEFEWEITHPPILNDQKELLPHFRGTYKVQNNEDQFFLGDTFWEPLEAMEGEWACIIRVGKQILAKKVFQAFVNN